MKLVVSQQSAVGSQQSSQPAFKLPAAIFRTFVCVVETQLAKISAIFLLLFLQINVSIAQGDTAKTTSMPPVDMAGTMRSNGKIYVVVAVLVIILLGLVFYLIRLDRKISRLEKGTWKE